MRWERFLEGFDSLWDSEAENAEFDERREIVRAERSRRGFAEVLHSRARTEPLTVNVSKSALEIHATVVGATWVEGIVCGGRGSVIVPFHAVVSVTNPRCDCAPILARVFEHITIGARLRAVERAGSTIEVTSANRGFRGRVVAVWKDAFDVASGSEVWSVRSSAIHSIVLGGA